MADMHPEPGPARSRSYVFPALTAAAGVAVLLVALALGQVVSMGSALGVLLLLSAAVRFEIARRS